MTFTWKTGINGDWGAAANWDVGTVPDSVTAAVLIGDSSDVVTIAAGESFIVQQVSLYFGTLDLNGSLTGGSVIDTAGVLSVGTNATLAGLTVINGTLQLNGNTLQVAGPVSFGEPTHRATISGPGTLSTSGTTSIPVDSIGGLDLTGGAVWSNSGTVNAYSQVFGADNPGTTSEFSNAAAGVWNIAGDFGGLYGDTSSFTNDGLFEKTGTSGTSYVGSAFTNTGTIDVVTGTVQFYGGGTFGGVMTGAGSIVLSGGAVTLASGVSLAGLGQLLVSGGVVTLSSDTAIPNLTLDGGAIELSGNALTATGSIGFGHGGSATGGTIDGPGTIQTTGTVTVGAGASGYAQLLLGGGAVWRNTGTANIGGMIQYGDVASAIAGLVNEAGATMNLTTDVAGLSASYSNGTLYGTGTLTNNGLLEKTGGTGVSTINMALDGTGNIAITSGTLQFTDGGVVSGNVTGAGTFEIGGGIFDLSKASISSQTHVVIQGGVVTIGSASVNNGTLTLGGGAIALGSNTTVPVYFGMTAGAVQVNSNTLTLSGIASITGGYPYYSGTNLTLPEIDGAGVLITSGTMFVNPNSYSTGYASLIVGGGLLWVNTGTVNVAGTIAAGDPTGGAFDIVNAAGAVFNFTADTGAIANNPYSITTVNPYGQTITTSYTGSSTFENAGTLSKINTPGTSTVASYVTNTGTINAATGVLEFTGGGSFAGKLTGAATVGFGGGTADLTNLTALVSGGIAVYGGQVLLPTGFASYAGKISNFGGTATLAANLAESGAFAMANASLMQLNGNTLSLSGPAFFYTSYYNAIPELDGPGALNTSGTTSLQTSGSAWPNGLLLGGGVTWTNTGTVNASAAIEVGDAAGNTAAIVNAVGGVYNIIADIAGVNANSYTTTTLDPYGRAVGTNYTGISTFVNAGVLSKLTQPGTTDVASVMTNTGTINVATGTLRFDNGGSFAGKITGAGTIAFSGGTADLSAVGAFSSGGILVDGATVLLPTALTTYAGGFNVTAGTVTLQASLAESGASYIVSGNTSAVVSLNSFTLQLSGPAMLGSASNYAGPTEIDGPGTLVTKGTTTLPSTSYGALLLGGGMTWTNTGTVNVSASIEVGDVAGNTATIANAAGGVFNLNADVGGIAQNQYSTSTVDVYGQTITTSYIGTSSFSNAGLLQKLTQPGTTHITSVMSNSGTIRVATGTLQFDGGGSFGGTITGAGVLAFGGGNATLNAGLSLAGVGGVLIDGTGTVTLGSSETLTAPFTMLGGYSAPAPDLLLNGNTLQLNGAASFYAVYPYAPAVDGPGTLSTSGTTTLSSNNASYAAMVLGSGATWTNSGTVNASASITVGDTLGLTAAIVNAATGVFDLLTDSAGVGNASIYVPAAGTYSTGNSTFSNAGLLEKTVQTATSDIASVMTNTGTIKVAAGTLEFDGGGSFGGTITGAGAVAFGNGNATLAAGLVTTGLGSLVIDGSGTVTLGASETLAASFAMLGAYSALAPALLLNSHTLQLNGSSTFNSISGYAPEADGSGTLSTSGTTTLSAASTGYAALMLGGGATWSNSGTVNASASLVVGDTLGLTAAIVNTGTGVFNIAADAGGIANSSIYVPSAGTYSYGSSTFANAGLLEKTTTSGTSTIASVVTNTGTIKAVTGTLLFTGGGSFGGTITGAGTVDFGGGTVSLTAGLSNSGIGGLVISSGTVVLGADETLAGPFAMNTGYSGPAPVLLLNSNTLQLNGAASFNTSYLFTPEVDGPGTLSTNGTTTVFASPSYGYSALWLGGGATWTNAGTVIDSGLIEVGDLAGLTAAFVNNASGIFNITADAGGISNNSPTYVASAGTYSYASSTFANAGLLEKTATSGTSTIASVVTNTGTIKAVTGTLLFTGGGSFGGTITGAGTVDFGGGTVSLTAGLSNTGIGALAITGGTVTLGANETLAGPFAMSGNATPELLLAGNTLQLNGAASFSTSYSGPEVDGPGTLSTAGTTTLTSNNYAALVLGGAATWTNSGTVNASGSIAAGDAIGLTAAIINAATGVFDLIADVGGVANNSIYVPSAGTYSTGSSTFSNAGLLEKTTTSGTSTIASLMSSTGTISIASGTMMFTAGGSFGGTITGSGTLGIGGGSVTLAAGLSMTGLGNLLFTRGTLALAGSETLNGGFTMTLAGPSLLELNGNTFQVGGTSALAGEIDGAGTLSTGGTTWISTTVTFDAGAVWSNSGTANVASQILTGNTLGATAGFVNAATGVFNLTSGNGGISNNLWSVTTLDPSNHPETTDYTGTSTFTNAGLLEKTTTADTSYIYSVVNNTGTIKADTGILQFNGGGTFGGTLTGAGAVAFGGGSSTLAAGTSLSGLSRLMVDGGNLILGANETCAGSFDMVGAYGSSPPTLQLNGNTLQLTGSVSFSEQYYNKVSEIDGPGVFSTSGTTRMANTGFGTELVLLGGGAIWQNSGTINTSAAIYAGDTSGASATIVNTASGVFDITQDSGAIYNNSYTTNGTTATGNSTFNNVGLLEKTGTSGSSNLYSYINNTGTISVGTGTLLFYGGGNFGGTITGSGIADFAAGVATLDAGISLSSLGSIVDAGTVALAGNITISAAFNLLYTGFIELSGHTLQLAGPATFGAFSYYSGGYIFSGEIDGPGTLSTTGTTNITNAQGALGVIMGGGAVWQNSGTVNAVGYVLTGDSIGLTSSVVNTASGVFNLMADSAGFQNGYVVNSGTYNYGTATFSNAGLLEKTTTNGTSVIYSAVTNTGTITVSTGTIEFVGGGNFGGTFTGPGTVLLAGGTTTLDAGVSFASLGNLVVNSSLALAADITIASPYSTNYYSGGLELNGHTLHLSGTSAFQAYPTTSAPPNPNTEVDGPGTLWNSGTMTLITGGSNAGLIIGGGATLQNTGLLISVGSIDAGDTPGTTVAIVNAAAGTFDISADTGGVGNNYYQSSPGTYATGSSTFNNAGLLEKTGGSSTSIITSLITNTGTIQVSTGAIEFTGGGSFGGTINGSGSVYFAANATLATGLTFAGSGGWYLFGNDTLSLAGAITQGNSGTIATSGELLMAGGTLSGAGQLTVQGSGTILGTGTIATTLANSGTIFADGGVLKLTGPQSGSGMLFADATGTLELGAAASTAVTFNGNGATVVLDSPASFTGSLGGITIGDTLVLKGVSATQAIVSGGTLTVTLTGGATETFALSGSTTGLRPGITLVSTGGTTDSDIILGVYAPATASNIAPSPVSFGNVHQNDTISQALTIGNTATANGWSENLDASITSSSPGIVTASGSVSLLAAGQSSSTALSVGLTTTTLGVHSGYATVALQTDGAGVSGNAPTSIGSQLVNVSGTVYELAAPVFASTTLNLGAARVGAGTLSAYTQLFDGSNSTPYQESLSFSAGAVAGYANFNQSGTIVSGGNALLGAILSTGTAGSFVGETQTISLSSTGVGTDGLADTALSAQTLTLNGKIYATATANTAGTLTFGTVHVGDNAIGTLSIANTGSGALVDNLTGSWGAISAGFSGSGSLGSVVAGGTGSLGMAINTTNAGIDTGTATLSLFSSDADLANLAVGSGSITLSGTVDNYAVAAFKENSGSATLSGSGTNWTLNFGTLTVGAAASTVDIGALNGASGLADLLGGTYTVTAGTGFTNGGFNAFSGLGAGTADTSPTISLATTTAGTYTETVVVHSTGTNGSGYSGALSAETLMVTGVIQTPGTSSGGGTGATVSAPTIAAITPDSGVVGDNITNSHTISLSGTAPAGTTVTLSRTGIGTIGTASATAGGTWSFNYTGTSLPDGVYVFTATAADALGNVSTPTATVVTVDSHTPSAPAITSVSPDTGTVGDGITSAHVLTLGGTAEAGDTVSVSSLSAGVLGTTIAGSNGAWSFLIPSSLADGSYSFTATGTDLAGTTSSISAAYSVVVSSSTPTTPVITGITPDTGVSATDGVTSANRITVSGSGTAGSTIALSVDGTVLGSAVVAVGGAWSVSLTGLPLGDGAHSLTAVATNAGGNSSAASSAYGVMIASGATTLGTPLATPAGDYFIANTPAALLAASRPISGPGGSYNTLIVQGDGTIGDAAFAGLSSIQAITLNGTGTESVTLGANALAMAGSYVALSVPNAANYTINSSDPLYLLGGTGNATVQGNNAGDYLIFNGGVVNITEGAGSDFITLAGNELNLAGTTINGGGGYNRLLLNGSNTIADSSFLHVSNMQELDFVGGGAQSVTLGADAHAAFGSSLTVYTASASSLVINASGIGGTGITATDAGTGTDTFIAGTGGAYFTGSSSGLNTFEVGLGGTDYISDFAPALDNIVLQAGGFTTLAQVLAASTQYPNGIDINIGNGAHVVLLNVQEASLHASNFGLSS